MTQINPYSEARLAVSTPAEIRAAYIGTVYQKVNSKGFHNVTIVGYCEKEKAFTVIVGRNMVPHVESFAQIDNFLRQLNAAELSKRLMASVEASIEPLENRLARKFSEILLEWCGPKELKAMNARNLLEKDKSICHSHDFCDANMAMAEACEFFGINWEMNNSPVDYAWNLAKKNQFYKLWK